MNALAGPRVLVFDSGIGGLSIAASIGARLRSWQLVYLADNAFFPYGDQPEAVVVERCVSLIDSVMAAMAAESAPIDMIVIGCNTASTVALPALRQKFQCPVIGVVPAIKPAAALSVNRRIGLLATPATVRRPYLDNLIAEFASDCAITRIGSSELVRLAEQWLATGEIADEARRRILEPFRSAEVDTVVLGCTHFPLIRDLLQPVLGTGTQWVDSGDAIARRVEALWRSGREDAVPGEMAPDGVEARLEMDEGSDLPFRFYFTGAEPVGLRRYLEGSGWPPPEVIAHYRPELVTLEN